MFLDQIENEKSVLEEFNSGKRGSTVGLGMYRLAKDHLSQCG